MARDTRAFDHRYRAVILYRLLIALGQHCGFPELAGPFRVKTKDEVERPSRYIRQDFFPALTFRNLDTSTPSSMPGSSQSPVLGSTARGR